MSKEESHTLEGRYSVLDDRRPDTSIYKITSKDITFYQAVKTGWPLVWSGYDFGSLPYYGWGLTKEEAVIDLLRGMRAAMSRKATPAKLPERNVDDLLGTVPDMRQDVPENQSSEAQQ